mmetsp:Transcript_13703/g.35161  ORF Transcript_13703/g.35161 Transcript_13703/m.35161 type:complete len:383 (+) Transcript_13703:271-1419(+)
MAPHKREWSDMMFDADPVFEIEMVMEQSPRAAKRTKEAHAQLDLSTYLGSSDDEFDAVVPSAEVLELEVAKAAPDGRFGSAFIGGASKTIFAEAMMSPVSPDGGFQDLGDLSSSDDDNGYATMFNSPAHVLDAEYDVPFIDSLAVADTLLVETSDAAMDEVVRALSAPSSPAPHAIPEPKPAPELAIAASVTAGAVATTAPVAAAAASAAVAAMDPSAVPPMGKDGKPGVNPTRWAHNSTERKRRLEIRKLFSGLRDLFDDIAGDDKISNITTLNRAIEHVADLKKVGTEQEASLVMLQERNAELKVRAKECEELQMKWEEEQMRAMADFPPDAAAVLEGSTDPELRKQLPAALRQLLDHNGRGAVEQKPLARRRKVAALGV